MPTFAVRFDESQVIRKFVDDTNIRLENPDIAKNPFNGYAYSITDDGIVAVFKMKTIIPDITWVGLLVFAGMFLFFQSITLWMILPLCLTLTGIFHTPQFCVWVIKKALKKYNYDGKVKLLKTKDLIDYLTDRMKP